MSWKQEQPDLDGMRENLEVLKQALGSQDQG